MCAYKQSYACILSSEGLAGAQMTADTRDEFGNPKPGSSQRKRYDRDLWLLCYKCWGLP